MTELRVGVDLVDVDRFARALDRWPGLAGRVFTDAEIAECRGATDRLAARFAAKEAAFKALGKGWPDLGYHDVEVCARDGAPVLRFRAAAAARAAARETAVSLSHTGGFAIAQVVMA